jgi:photosystem II stability/assembly factor-like uncharacterized protein
MLLGIFWFLNLSTDHGQEKASLLLSAATHEGHPMKMSAKKADEGFQHVHALAMDVEGGTLFLGTHAGLFRSGDRGRSWKKVALSATQSSLDMMGMTPDPKDPKTIYVATHEAGVFKSTDGGETWKQVNNGLGGLDVHGLAIDPITPQK